MPNALNVIENGPDEIVIANPNYGYEFLSELNKFRNQGLMTDCVICVGEDEFKCHKNVLAVSSQYFRTMFSSSLKESHQTRITFKDICPSSMNKIIDYVYTGRIEINASNAQEILTTAHLFDYPTIIDAACALLSNHLHESNCLGILKLAKLYDCSKLEKAAREFSLSQFLTVCEYDEFLLLDIDDLIELISDDDLDVIFEISVYNAIVNWINYNVDIRKIHFERLLNEIRLKHINRFGENFIEKLRQQVALFDFDWKPFENLIKNQHNKARPSTIARDLILMLDYETQNDLTTFEPSRKKWSSIGQLPEHLIDFSLNVLSYEIYIIGGTNTTDFSLSLKSYRFDCSQRSWKEIAPMLKVRTNHASCCCRNCIFVFGGLTYNDKFDKENCDSIECYNPDYNQWTTVGTSRFSRLNSKVVPLGETFYEIGGRLHNAPCSSVESYKLLQDGQVMSREEELVLCDKSEYINMLEINDLFYLVCKRSKYFYVMDPKRRTLKRLADLRNKFERIGICVLNNELYLSGIYDSELYIEKFVPIINKWENIEQLPASECSFQACATVHMC